MEYDEYAGSTLRSRMSDRTGAELLRFFSEGIKPHIIGIASASSSGTAVLAEALKNKTKKNPELKVPIIEGFLPAMPDIVQHEAVTIHHLLTVASKNEELLEKIIDACAPHFPSVAEQNRRFVKDITNALFEATHRLKKSDKKADLIAKIVDAGVTALPPLMRNEDYFFNMIDALHIGAARDIDLKGKIACGIIPAFGGKRAWEVVRYANRALYVAGDNDLAKVQIVDAATDAVLPKIPNITRVSPVRGIERSYALVKMASDQPEQMAKIARVVTPLLPSFVPDGPKDISTEVPFERFVTKIIEGLEDTDLIRDTLRTVQPFFPQLAANGERRTPNITDILEAATPKLGIEFSGIISERFAMASQRSEEGRNIWFVPHANGMDLITLEGAWVPDTRRARRQRLPVDMRKFSSFVTRVFEGYMGPKPAALRLASETGVQFSALEI